MQRNEGRNVGNAQSIRGEGEARAVVRSPAADETSYAGEGFFDVVHAGGIGAANKTLATGPKRGAGYHCHLLLDQ
jgi:hypothetical protein